MDERYLMAAVRYVELNPVRAEMVQNAWDYRWSSAAAHVTGEDDRLVRVRPMLGVCRRTSAARNEMAIPLSNSYGYPTLP